MQLRADLLLSFQDAVRPIGVLDRFQVAGVIASWWADTQNDLKTIGARGFMGLVESWEASIINAIEDKSSDDAAIDHKLVKLLLPEYLADIELLQAKKAGFEATVKAASGDDGEDDENGKDDADQLSAEKFKEVRKDLAIARKQLKSLQKDFIERLQKACSQMNEASARDLVTGILEAELRTTINRYVAGERELVVSAFESWWDKYRRTLDEIERARAQTQVSLEEILRGLRYV